MIDWCIRAPSEAVAKAVVRASGRNLLDDDGNWILAGEGHALDPNILIVSNPVTGALEPGWFANLRITNGEDIEPLLMAASASGVEIKHPVTPRRVWA
jgi:hypothetical protein